MIQVRHKLCPKKVYYFKFFSANFKNVWITPTTDNFGFIVMPITELDPIGITWEKLREQENK